MRIGVPGEAEGETRVAIVPSVAKRLRDRGLEVLVAAGAGTAAGWADDDYREVGCTVLDDAEAVLAEADVVLLVRGLGAVADPTPERFRDGQVVVGLLGPYAIGDDVLESLADRRISAFAMELLPRISRAQGMDVLTSMASLAGYKAAVRAADELPKLFPMQMTAAGTVRPANVFVVGAGVAGLQAIATAKRLGARVSAYDIRPAVAEEVESLGATFLDLGLSPTVGGDDGYAREQDAAFYRRQREAMTDAVGAADVVITAAAVPGRRAPTLVTREMVDGMAPGSVIVDLGAEGGGNCEVTRPDGRVDHEGVTVLGPTNLPATLPRTASQLLATNLVNFLEGLLTDDGLRIDENDELVDATLLTHDGAVRAPHREASADAA